MAGAVAPVDIDVTVKGLSEVEKLSKRIMALEKEITRLQGKLPKAANGIKTFGRASTGASAGVKTLGAAINAALGPIGAALLAVGGLTAAFQTLKATDFAASKFRSLGGDSVALAAELKKVSKDLNGSASVAELTGAAYDVASAGFIKAADAAQILKAASLGATGGFSDINTVGNAATSVLNAYGLAASEASGLVDKFIQTQNDGKIVIGEYAANIAKVAPVSAALGIELEEVNAIIAQVTASGTQAEVAFTGLKTALAQLASGNANKALSEIGIQISAADIEAEGLIGVLQRIKDSGIDVGLAFKAFGNEAAPVLQTLFNDLERTNQLLENQKNSVGAAAEAQLMAADTIEGAWKRVSTALSNIFSEQERLGQTIKVLLDATAISVQGLGKAINFLFPQIWRSKEATDALAKSSAEAAAEQEAAASKTQAAAEAAKAAAAERVASLAKEISGLEEVSKQIDNQTLALQTQQAAADNNTKLTQARFAAEEAINGVLLDQANQRLNNAKTAAEQLKAAQDIYNLTLQQAEIEYQSTLAAIEGMVKKAEMQAKAVQLKFKELEATVALAQAEGTITEEHEKALEAQGQAIKMSTEMLKTTRAVAVEQRKGAEAIFSGAQSTAKAAFEQNKVWQATTNAANAAGVFAQNMGSAASQAASVASSMEKAAAASGSMKGSSFSVDSAAAYAAQYSDAPTGTGPKRQTFGELMSASSRYQSVINKEKKALQENSWATTAYTQAAKYASIGYNKAAGLLTRYADSLNNQPGPNTGKQKVQAAMEQYRQASNPNQVAQQVNIQTGPVTQMDGTNYVTTSDLQNATASAAQQGANLALSQLQNNPGVRRAVGVSR